MTRLPQASKSKITLRATSTALALAVLFATASQSAQAQTYRVLYTFTGVPDGAAPEAGVVRDAEGNLYGTTLAGGDFTCNQLGCGVVFKNGYGGKGNPALRV